MKELVEKYIVECEQVITEHNTVRAEELQKRIVATFSNYIVNIDKKLSYNMANLNGPGYYSKANYLENIIILKCKLEAFLANNCIGDEFRNNEKLTFVMKNENNNQNDNINNNTNSNTNISNTNLSIIFNKTRKTIEENEFLSEKELKEILDKINEIEEISKLNESKNKKWFKLRPTMEWLGTKGISVATSILGLITTILNMA